MKKVLFVLVCLFTIGTQACSLGDDRPVEVNQLPAKAQQFIKDHFGSATVSYALQDTDLLDRSYKVVFTNSDKIEFTRSGEWTEVDCEHTEVPASIIPPAIAKHVAKKHKGQTIVEIKREKRRYEVTLKNDLELEFTLDGKFIGFD